MKETPMNKEELAAIKERLAKRTRDEMEREWADPKFREDYAAWEREYRATVALYKARQKANLTQAELARRMRTPLQVDYALGKTAENRDFQGNAETAAETLENEKPQ